MERITAKSKKRVVQLFVAGPGYERVSAPRGLTVRKLIGHQRYKTLLSRYTFAVLEGDHLVCLWNLKNLGFDYL